ncbi:MAG: electron transfer flavoprotein-ubiquinone oxidoreductase [Epsilonproteobacteria bacterium]|nr:electron transfer flavoprotein-ubiquinone oxidoreductase [Campylobacterota bacterium]
MDSKNSVSTDVLIVGAGPSGLSTAIYLANVLADKGHNGRILLVEKGESIGSHILSGAVIRPEVFEELLPYVGIEDIPFDTEVVKDTTVFLTSEDSYDLPFHPPYMNNMGNQIASLGQVCKYLANVAEKKGVEIYTGFAVDSLLYDEEGKVCGAKTKDTGIDHHGNKMPNYQEGTSIDAKITILAEGTRGSLAKTLITEKALDDGKNPQIYSLGVKELWSVPESSISAGEVYHTAGYPLKDGEEFGGGFIYGLSNNRVALGLVVGLDYKDPTFDIHAAMQVWKQHPFVSTILEGGTLLEFGAKTLPEGGYNAIPKMYGDNFIIIGDSAGLLATASLKGVHLAVQSGINAAKSAAKALIEDDTSEAVLKTVDKHFKKSRLYEELYPVRNFRQSFNNGLISGALRFGVQLITKGACLTGDIKTQLDHKSLRKFDEPSDKKSFYERFSDKLEFDKVLTFDKVTDVFYSKATHDEEQLCHLVVDKAKMQTNIKTYGAPCQHFCPAEVYELHTNKSGHQELRLHAENCVHCKTCDIKSPNNAILWVPPYGGDGPQYDYM